MGAVQEGLLRKSFQKNGEYLDQVLYAIVEDDWRAAQNIAWPTNPLVH
jgi:RimJ/RimL family protein N-acetyltransferase